MAAGGLKGFLPPYFFGRYMKKEILSWENIDLAWKLVRKNHHRSRQVIRFEKDLLNNLWDLRESLDLMNWKPGPYRMFTIYEPKERLIAAPCLKNRIVQQMWTNITNPVFESSYIEHSYACRIGKGMLKACIDLQCSMQNLRRDEEWFVLKIDFRKFFHSVNHETIKRILRQYVDDDLGLYIADSIINSYNPGLPIGSLTSQILANVVLNEVDHYSLDRLKIKKYGRYMDDIYVLGNNRDILEDHLEQIAGFASNELNLNVNGRKCRVVTFKKPYSKANGIDFCGYRVYPDKLYVRRSTLKRAIRRIKAVMDRVSQDPELLTYLEDLLISIHGLLKYADDDAYTRMIKRTVISDAYRMVRLG